MAMTKRRVVTWALAAVAVAILVTQTGAASAAAQAGPSISRVVVLGDSFSDNGNLYARTGGPLPPYWQGRISNGPVAVEYLAQKLGVALSDFAWAGATTGVGNGVDGGTADTLGVFGLPGMTTALQNALGAEPVDPDALYVIWGGGIDLGSAVTDPADALVIIGKAVTNLVNMALRLQSLGATRILVLNLQDFAKAPAYRQEDLQIRQFITQGIMAFNQALKANLPPGLHYFDTFARVSDFMADPEDYGLSNVTDQLISAPGADPATYFYWDRIHLTTAGHSLLANALYESIAPTVIIGGNDSGVPNLLLSNGSTISDLIALAAIDAEDHDEFVSSVAAITNDLMKGGLISGRQKGAIQSCAAQAMIPPLRP